MAPTREWTPSAKSAWAVRRSNFTIVTPWRAFRHFRISCGISPIEPGKCYVAYLANSGGAKVTLAAGRYHAKWFNPRTGAWLKLPDANQAVDGVWTSPAAADAGDWALLLQAK
jgi:hypothetical protein